MQTREPACFVLKKPYLRLSYLIVNTFNNTNMKTKHLKILTGVINGFLIGEKYSILCITSDGNKS